MEIDTRLEDVIDCLYRVAVKAVIVQNGKVLLTRDNRDIGWTFPGGGVDVGENPTEALVRELAEEIGIQRKDAVVADKVLAVTLGHIKDGIPRCNVHFAVKLQAEPIMSGEIEAMEWVTVEDLHDETFDLSAGKKEDVIRFIRQADS